MSRTGVLQVDGATTALQHNYGWSSAAVVTVQFSQTVYVDFLYCYMLSWQYSRTWRAIAGELVSQVGSAVPQA